MNDDCKDCLSKEVSDLTTELEKRLNEKIPYMIAAGVRNLARAVFRQEMKLRELGDE